MRRRAVATHRFAEGLLERPNEYVRFWLFGRLSIVWDTNRPVRQSVPTKDLFPAHNDTDKTEEVDSATADSA